LFGVRLGATLATLAAMERDDVAGVVAIAPVVRGRGYIRELTMLGQGASTADDGTCDALESAGFLLTRETAAFIARVDLRTVLKRPAPRVLIVERDDCAGDSGWAPALQRLDADVRVEHWAGYAAMMDDPQRAVVPALIVAGVVACLNDWSARVAVAPVTAETPHRIPLRSRVALPCGANAQILERPVHIDTGTSTRLFGMLVTPERRGSNSAVLMLNAGSVHHIGPNRLWVRLARQWAARGLTVLRLDFAGIGDTPARPGAPENDVYSAYAMHDVAAALDYLRTEAGISECHLVGLCSGAYHSLKAAVAGQPVESVLIINPLTYFWDAGARLGDVKDYEIAALSSKFRGKLFTRAPWLKLVHGSLDVRLVAEVTLRRVWRAVAPQLVDLARLLRIPLRHDLARELDSAVQRGIRLRFVFAERAPGLSLLREQGGRAVQRLFERQAASIDFVADADHTFTRLAARERLVAVLDRLMLAPGGQSEPGPG
jgi:hypothetical protein